MEALSTQLPPFFQWLVKVSFQASILVCLILLIRFVLRERLPIRWHYYLWLLLLVRLSLPWSPQSRLSIYNLYQPSRWASPTQFAAGDTALQPKGTDQVESSIQTEAKTTVGAEATPKPGTRAILDSQHQRSTMPPAEGGRTGAHWANVLAALPVLWLAGAIALGSYVLARNVWLWRAVKKERAVTDQAILDLLEDCKMEMRVQTIIGVVVTDRIESPALFGFVRPRILLPQGLIETLGLDELHYVFLHELAHLRRRDIYLAWLVCLLQVLHWFNPLIWFGFRRLRADQEMACDALVLSRISADEPAAYGRTIVSLLDRFSRPQYVPSLAGILENPSHIERRIEMIAKFKNNSYRWSPLAVGLIVILCCISLPDARSGKAAQPTSASASVEQPATPVTAESNVFVDPNTGITFQKTRALSGPSDVIESTSDELVQMSPNGRFLLWGVKVIPLEGGTPFDLVDMPSAGRSSWSPDGKRVAFQEAGAIWVVPVNPETGHPTGREEKLYQADDLFPFSVGWSPDPERIAFARFDKESGFAVWTLSVSDKSLAKVRDPSSLGNRSPDGKHVAWNMNGLRVKSTEDGEAKKITDNGTPILWSADGAWLLYRFWPKEGEELRFFHLTDGREGTVKLPAKGSLVGASADRKKLFCYCPSYDWQSVLQVVSVSGGPACQLGGQMHDLKYFNQFWSPDSGNIMVEGEFKGDDSGLWALPLSGGAPVALRMDIAVPGKIRLRQLSPGLDHLLLCVTSDDKTYDLWLAPVSWKQMRTTGPATLVFRNWDFISAIGSCTPGIWSHDGKKIAIMRQKKGEIWIVSVEGGEPVQLKGPGMRGWPVWAPDGSMIAFYASLSATEHVVQVVSASGGDAKTLAQFDLPGGMYVFGKHFGVTWSPDGQALTLPKTLFGGLISSVSISDGQSHPLVDLKDTGKEMVSDLSWSPDGKTLAFGAQKRGESSFQGFLFHSQDGHITKIADEVPYFFWSPDSKWLSYNGFRYVKSRPEGVLWEMDVEEALAQMAK
jgi:beta-lactamase regulating signal transducer with metallopeptidase domain/Tol biopolymer transport system component